jgi:hypothetical protein
MEISLEDVKRLAAQARREWLQGFTNEDMVKAKTKERLDQQFNTLICHYLNFKEASAGGHRYRSSPVTRFVIEASRKAIEQWCSDQGDNMPKLSKENEDHLKAHYLFEYERLLKEKLEALAHTRAEADAEEVISDMVDIFDAGS